MRARQKGHPGGFVRSADEARQERELIAASVAVGRALLLSKKI
jgi:hypothetical protein